VHSTCTWLCASRHSTLPEQSFRYRVVVSLAGYSLQTVIDITRTFASCLRYLSGAKQSSGHKMKLSSGCVAPSAGKHAEVSWFPRRRVCRSADHKDAYKMEKLAAVWHWRCLSGGARRPAICRRLDAEHTIIIVSVFCEYRTRWSASDFSTQISLEID